MSSVSIFGIRDFGLLRPDLWGLCRHGICVCILAGTILAAQQSAPQSPATLFKEADAAYQRGDIPRAIRLYQELLKLQPDSVPARANLAVVFAHVGRYDEAIAQYKQALKRAPKNPDILLNLALARYKQADFEGAAADLESLRSAHPENRQSLYLLADCYLRLGINRSAIALLRPVYDVDPTDLTVDFALGVALLRDGQVREGEVIIDRVLKNGGTGQVNLLLGAAQLSAGDAKTAASTLRKALTENPDLPGGWSLYGKALLDTEDREAAKTSFQRALKADPNDFDANLCLGGMLRHDGKITEATPYLKKALSLRPASIEVRFQMGILSLVEDDLEEARQYLEEVERESPDFQEVHAQLAVLYARMKRLEDSKREREIVLQLNEKARTENTRNR